jgi:hypothetical protein
MPDKKIAQNGIMRKFVDNGDGTFSEGVAVLYGGGGGGGSSGPTTSTVVTLYTVTTAFAGADLNDTLAETTVLTSGGDIQNTIWTNITKDTTLASPPAGANISQQARDPLTNFQLRLSPVAVSVAALPLPTGAATAALQTALNTAVGAPGDATAANDTGSFSLVAFVKRGLLNWTTLLGRIPALVNNRVPVQNSVPTAASGAILTLTTNATGTTFTAFANTACVALDIVNNTGTTIEYRRGATGTAMQIPTGSARLVVGITNANQIDVRRTDTSNVQVTLQAEAFTA